MTRTSLHARTCAAAIAAALFVTPTFALAQEAQPATTDTAPPEVTTTPAPATETAPATTETAAPAATTTRTVTHHTTVAKRTVAPARPATVTRTVTHKVSTVARTAPAPVAAAAPAPAPAASPKPAPIVDLNAKPATAPAAPAASPLAHSNNDTALELGGGALALLMLGGAAFALSRRRRADEEEWHDEQATTDYVEPVAADTPVMAEPAAHEPETIAAAAAAPSAFAWGHQGTDADNAEERDDRLPGESWIERAYRGPSPNNPSVSLKARLKRAAFFDKREREVAAGIAEPVDPDEGLPEAMVEQHDGELA